MEIDIERLYKVKIYYGWKADPAFMLYWFGTGRDLEQFGMFINYWNFSIENTVMYAASLRDLKVLWR